MGNYSVHSHKDYPTNVHSNCICMSTKQETIHQKVNGEINCAYIYSTEYYYTVERGELCAATQIKLEVTYFCEV